MYHLLQSLERRLLEEHGPNMYEQSCCDCEIWVTIRTNAERLKIVRDGGMIYHRKKKNSLGICLTRDVAAINEASEPLRAKDQLMPQRNLPDTGKFTTHALPLRCSFWRGPQSKKTTTNK